MTTLYTNGDFITLSPSQFNSYSLIRYSATDLLSPVAMGFTISGIVDFSLKLGTVSAQIQGWTGADRIISGAGFDTLWGNAGNDSLYGNAGNDLLLGDWDDGFSTGNDALFGGDGNDELIGGFGDDNLQGGNGDDIFSYGETMAGNDLLSGGAGFDGVLVRDGFGIGLSEVSFNRLVLTAAASVEFFAVDNPSIVLRGTNGNDLIDLSGTSALTRNGVEYLEQIYFDLGV